LKKDDTHFYVSKSAGCGIAYCSFPLNIGLGLATKDPGINAQQQILLRAGTYTP